MNNKTEYNKKPDPNSKPIRYLHNKAKGMTKAEAAEEAGYKGENNTSHIEDTKTYRAGLEEFKVILLAALSEEKAAGELVKNIMQDVDKGAKNNALKQWIGIIFPTEDIELESGSVKIYTSPKE